jgi:hypothetical protein
MFIPPLISSGIWWFRRRAVHRYRSAQSPPLDSSAPSAPDRSGQGLNLRSGVTGDKINNLLTKGMDHPASKMENSVIIASD